MTRPEFDTLVHELSRQLYGLAFRFLSNREEAEDAVQEVFIRMWRMNDKLGEYRSIGALASTMTKNYCIDQIRKRKRELPGNQSNRDIIAEEPSSGPYEQFEQVESSAILDEIIRSLDHSQRELIRMREMEELSYEEIAQVTGQNVNAIRVSMSRLRKTIKDKFIKHYHERRKVENPA